MTRVLRRMVCCFVLLAWSAAPVAAQPSDDQIGEMATFFILFPELRTLPAPEALTLGLRASYSAAAAGGGTGGGGVLQYDVVGADATTVVLHQTNYADIGAGVIPLGSAVARGVPGLGPFWIHPSVLVNAEALSSDGLSVTRYDKEVAGTVRTVVRFQTDTSDGGRVVHEFSAASGLLAFNSIGTVESGGQVVLLGVRQVAPPWPVDAAPNWARMGATIRYEGTKSTDIPGAGRTDQPLQVAIEVTSASRFWSTYTVNYNLAGLVSVGELGVGVAQINGALWLPRAALRAQIPSQPSLVDTDPVTGAQTFLVSEGGGIVLQQELSGAITRWTYDGTFGVLNQQRVQQAGPVANEETLITRSGGSDLEALSGEAELPDTSAVPPAGGGGAGGPTVVVPEEDDDRGCTTAGGRAPASLLLLLLFSRSRGPRRRIRPRSR